MPLAPAQQALDYLQRLQLRFFPPYQYRNRIKRDSYLKEFMTARLRRLGLGLDHFRGVIDGLPSLKSSKASLPKPQRSIASIS
jgi:hypothetical protein